jgi:excisionase family DNA binding protein
MTLQTRVMSPTTSLPPLMVNAADAARMLACSDTHLRRLVARGLIVQKFDGNRRRFPVASLEAYVDGLSEDPA